MLSFMGKYLVLPQRFSSLLAELLVVFIGVFAAFLLSDYQQQHTKAQQQIEIVKALRADLTAYIDNGTAANSGFIDFFSNINIGIQRQIAKGELTQIPGIIIGDYWYLEALHPMFASGKLNDLQLDLHRDLARFNTLHQNFAEISVQHATAMVAAIDRYYRQLALQKPTE